MYYLFYLVSKRDNIHDQNFFDSPIVVEINLLVDFSVTAILAFDGEVYKIMNNRNGFNYLLEQIKKVSMKATILIESTGIYQLTLSQFLKNIFGVSILNPNITK